MVLLVPPETLSANMQEEFKLTNESTKKFGLMGIREDVSVINLSIVYMEVNYATIIGDN
jgi:hypothetical protein